MERKDFYVGLGSVLLALILIAGALTGVYHFWGDEILRRVANTYASEKIAKANEDQTEAKKVADKASADKATADQASAKALADQAEAMKTIDAAKALKDAEAKKIADKAEADKTPPVVDDKEKGKTPPVVVDNKDKAPKLTKDEKLDPKKVEPIVIVTPKATAPKLDPKDFVSKAEFEENKQKVGEKLIAVRDEILGRADEVEQNAKLAITEVNKRVDGAIKKQADDRAEDRKILDKVVLDVVQVDSNQKKSDKETKAALAEFKSELGNFKGSVNTVVLTVNQLVSDAKKAADKGNITVTNTSPVNVTVNIPAGQPLGYKACPRERLVYAEYPGSIYFPLPRPVFAHWSNVYLLR